MTVAASQFARQEIAQQFARLARRMERTRQTADAAAIHRMRVAIRRFAQLIAISKPFLSAKDSRRSRRLKKIMAAAGDVRNCDVALELTAASRARDAAQIHAKLRARREESAGGLVRELRKWPGRKKMWEPAADHRSRESVSHLARTAIGRAAKRFLDQGIQASSPEATPRDLHRFRIAAKKLRYTLELLEPVLAPPAKFDLAAIGHAHRLLGEINDCVSAAALLAPFKGGKRLARPLQNRARKKAEEFRRFWKEELGGGTAVRGWIQSLARLGAQSRGRSSSPASSARDTPRRIPPQSAGRLRRAS